MSNEKSFNQIREMLGSTDHQWEIWMNNPRNLEIAKHASEVQKYKVVFEVISSAGCAAGHKVGDKIVFNGGGSPMCKESPEVICGGILGPISPMAVDVLDKICNVDDPTMRAFNKIHCADVGVEKGGWGEVVVEMKVEAISK